MRGSFKTGVHSAGAGEALAVTTAPLTHKDAIALSEADARRGRGTNISEVVVVREEVVDVVCKRCSNPTFLLNP
jgi:hypothetical protein